MDAADKGGKLSYAKPLTAGDCYQSITGSNTEQEIRSMKSRYTQLSVGSRPLMASRLLHHTSYLLFRFLIILTPAGCKQQVYI